MARANIFTDINSDTSSMRRRQISHGESNASLDSASSTARNFAGKTSVASDAVYTPRLAPKGEKLFVMVRVRPLVKREEGSATCVEMTPCVRSDGPAFDNPSVTLHGHNGKTTVFSNFHAVVDSTESGDAGTQDRVYEIIGRKAIENITGGASCCIFAYGQTGTGKTYTLLGVFGDQEHAGVLPRLCQDIFANGSDAAPLVSASAVEVYNDEFQDLLTAPIAGQQHQGKITVHSHPKLGIHLVGHNELVASSASELLQHCRYACAKRAVAATAMNTLSSRSHAIFIIKVEKRDGNGSATLIIADLAGHEKEKTTRATGERLRELVFINKTLLHLTQVISALADKCSGRNRTAHVPYRNSKLTMLLEPGLEGHGRCSSLVTLTPVASAHDESLQTLRFAAELSDIRIKPVVSAAPNKAKLLKLAQDEIEVLKAQLTERENSEQAVARLQEELDQARKLAGNFQQSWGDLSKHTFRHNKSLMNEGRGIDLAKLATVPLLVNLSDDDTHAGALCYELLQGTTAIGCQPEHNRSRRRGSSMAPILERTNSDGESDESSELDKPEQTRAIHVHGVGIEGTMLYIRSTEVEQALDVVQRRTSCRAPRPVMKLEALPYHSEGGPPRVLVNGLRLERPTRLEHGDRLILGYKLELRVAMPGHKKPTTIDDAFNEESDEAVAHLLPFVQFLRGQTGEVKSRAFLNAFTRTSALVEEVNYMTSVLRPRDGFVFALKVGMDTDTPDGIHIGLLVTLSQKSLWAVARNAMKTLGRKNLANTSANVMQLFDKINPVGENLAIWTLPEFKEKLEFIRELYITCSGEEENLLQYLKMCPDDDPWLGNSAEPKDATRLPSDTSSNFGKRISTELDNFRQEIPLTMDPLEAFEHADPSSRGAELPGMVSSLSTGQSNAYSPISNHQRTPSGNRDQMISDLRAVLRKTEAEKRQLHEALESSSTQLDDVNGALRRMEAERRQLQEASQSSEKQLEDLRAAFNASEAEKMQLHEALQLSEKRAGDVTAASHKAEPRRASQSSKRRADELRAIVRKGKADKPLSNEASPSSRKELDELRAALSKSEAEKMQLDEFLQSAKKETDELRTVLHDIEEENGRLNEASQASTKEMDELRAALHRTEVENSQLRDTPQSPHKEVSDMYQLGSTHGSQSSTDRGLKQHEVDREQFDALSLQERTRLEVECLRKISGMLTERATDIHEAREWPREAITALKHMPDYKSHLTDFSSEEDRDTRNAAELVLQQLTKASLAHAHMREIIDRYDPLRDPNQPQTIVESCPRSEASSSSDRKRVETTGQLTQVFQPRPVSPVREASLVRHVSPVRQTSPVRQASPASQVLQARHLTPVRQVSPLVDQVSATSQMSAISQVSSVRQASKDDKPFAPVRTAIISAMDALNTLESKLDATDVSDIAATTSHGPPPSPWSLSREVKYVVHPPQLAITPPTTPRVPVPQMASQSMTLPVPQPAVPVPQSAVPYAVYVTVSGAPNATHVSSPQHSQHTQPSSTPSSWTRRDWIGQAGVDRLSQSSPRTQPGSWPWAMSERGG